MNKRQRRNLAKLTLYVKGLDQEYLEKHFSMHAYLEDGQGAQCRPTSRIKRAACGTTACFAGHGPPAGLKAERGENWEHYCGRVFGAYLGEGRDASSEWMWLFSSDWPSVPEDACKRAAWALERGSIPARGIGHAILIPKGFQSFKPNWAKIKRIAEGKE